MRKLLNILLILNIIGLIIGFIISLFSSPLLALLIFPLGILDLVPIIAIINNMDSIDTLNDELYRIKYKLKTIEDRDKQSSEDIPQASIPEYRETANGNWECVKCGTINKQGTDACQNCKALYSAFINPTTNPYEKVKVSRWIKDKKK